MSPRTFSGIAFGVTLTLFLQSTPARAQICLGDCSDDVQVTVDEVITGVQLALGEPTAACSAFDPDGDHKVTVVDVVNAIDNVLHGCRDPLLITTLSGHLRGSGANGIRNFYGIPYAVPPVGELRWRPPQLHSGWNGVRNATQPGAVCPQRLPIINSDSGSEDCLYLNVQAPNPPPPSPVPVMVWIHGGGFTVGDGLSFGGTDGADIVRNAGVVVVSFNYRLGQLGFLAHPALTAEETEHPHSGVYGIEDQIAALQWVKRNIAAFGGDPNNVTIFGESAGGFSVCMHLASPLSAGLFQRAIVQSGLCVTTEPTASEAEAQGERFAAAIGCGDAVDVAACMRSKSLTQVRRTLPPDPEFGFDGVADVVWTPPIDGYVLPDQIGDMLDRGWINPVPVLIGSNRDEGTLFVALGWSIPGRPFTADTYAQVMSNFFGARGLDDDVAAQYPIAEYDSPAQAYAAAIGDALIACPTIEAAKRLCRRVPTFLYQFHYPDAPFILQSPLDLGAFHSGEIQYVFGHHVATTPFNADEHALSQSMMGYWTRFAATGDPNGDGAVDWPPHYGELANHLVFDAITTFATDPKRDKCRFWKDIGVVPPDHLDVASRERATNLAKWQAAGIKDYELDYGRSCFCPPPSEVRIVVRDNEVVSIFDAVSGEEIENHGGAFGSGFNSIDQLFEIIDNAIERRVESLWVEYDADLGYPKTVDIDYFADVADDTVVIHVRALRPQAE